MSGIVAVTVSPTSGSVLLSPSVQGVKRTPVSNQSEAKLFCSSRCTQICLEALQILGGNGYSKEFHVERFVRDAKLLEISEGTSEILRMVIGGTVLGK